MRLGFKFLFCILSIFIFGSVFAKTQEQPIAELGFVNIKTLPDGEGSISPIRLEALKDTATTLGARGALAWRSLHINEALEKEGAYLDQVFDFNQLLLKDNILPPVIEQGNSELNLNDGSTIRMADKIYKIVSPARFVTAPPTWRTYLWLAFEKPDRPSTSLLPRDQIEAHVWNEYLRAGWEEGLEQANDIFNANLSRLKRDYLGMILYKKMVLQRMISSPVIAKAELGVTGDENEMRVNDAVMRITDKSKLQLNPKAWKAIVSHDHD